MAVPCCTVLRSLQCAFKMVKMQCTSLTAVCCKYSVASAVISCWWLLSANEFNIFTHVFITVARTFKCLSNKRKSMLSIIDIWVLLMFFDCIYCQLVIIISYYPHHQCTKRNFSVRGLWENWDHGLAESSCWNIDLLADLADVIPVVVAPCGSRGYK